MTEQGQPSGILQQSASQKMQNVQTYLREMGLAPEIIEQAIKTHGDCENVDVIAAYALGLDNPEADCIEEELPEDMVSSDEDTNFDSVNNCVQSANVGAASVPPMPSLRGVSLGPLASNLAIAPIKVEPTSKDPQMEHQNKELGVKVEDWQDPICKLFATERTIPLDYRSLSKTFNSNDSLKLENKELTEEEVHSDEQIQKSTTTALPNSKDVERLPMASNFEERIAGFREMGFSIELIQRAIQLHGAQAEDSILLQFILDSRKIHIQRRNIDDRSKNDGPEEGKFALKAHVAPLAERSPPSHELKEVNVAKCGPDWESQESDTGDSDSDEDDEPPCRDPSPINRAAEASESFKPALLCSRPVPAGEGHRHLMLSHGFQPDLIERAIQELGEGVEADMLIEYMLYLTSEQEHGASTSEHASTEGVSTVEKLVTEFQFPSKVIERAVTVCHTPLWNAEENQIADLVDFVMAHGADLEEETNSDEVAEEDEIWSFFRDEIAVEVAEKRRGKRKIIDTHCSARAERVPMSRKIPSACGRKPREELDIKTGVEPLSSGSGRKTKVKVGRPQVTRFEGPLNQIEKHKGSIGFGLPGEPVKARHLSEDVKGAPFFYFENVASMPNDEWARIKRHLFDIEPEFVDALHFSACRRPRGYIHNLPIEGRRKILTDPPMTIQELMPQTRKFWPDWDTRTKLNCINTKKGTEFLAKKLQIGDGTALQTTTPSPALQQELLHWCRKWNLVWTAPNIPTPITENEIEAMLGFDPDHSRNCLNSSARFKALGNSFSVFTVAFHFSVLKPLYPRGINVLSLFSGIGGAEVALHKLGIKLLVVVSVELNDETRRCLEAWWAASKQTGVLNQEFHNVKDLGRAEISALVNKYRGFDLIVGGSPCNNLSGNNMVSRVGLEGQQSSVFFEFSRIVTAVREFTIRLQQR